MKKFLILLTIFFPFWLQAQTCCSGGVPLSSNLGLPPADAQTLQFTLSYDVNVLETLKTGRSILDDDSRSRKTLSTLLEVGYSFNSRFSIDAFLSYVRQERLITQFGREDFTYSEGIGDAVLLFKYQLFTSKDRNTIFTAAIGSKLPTGSANEKDQQGLTLNADLQPGSGAWDGILWGQFSHNLSFRPSMSLSVTNTYSFKGPNNEYLGNQKYQFGNEWQLMAGISDRLFIGRQIIDPAIVFRYRSVRPDRQNDQTVPSTGGQWIFFNPNLTYWFKDNFSFNINVDLPLLAHIEGTQVSPTYRLNLGLYYRLPLQKNNLNILNN